MFSLSTTKKKENDDHELYEIMQKYPRKTRVDKLDKNLTMLTNSTHEWDLKKSEAPRSLTRAVLTWWCSSSWQCQKAAQENPETLLPNCREHGLEANCSRSQINTKQSNFGHLSGNERIRPDLIQVKATIVKNTNSPEELDFQLRQWAGCPSSYLGYHRPQHLCEERKEEIKKEKGTTRKQNQYWNSLANTSQIQKVQSPSQQNYFTIKSAPHWPALQGVAGAELLQENVPVWNKSKQHREHRTQAKKE